MKYNKIRQNVLPVIAAFIWGTSFVAQDMAADVIDTFTFNAVRAYIAVVTLLIIIMIFNKIQPRKEKTAEQKNESRRQLVIGGLCCGSVLAVAANLQQAGIAAGTQAGKAGFITALYVVLVPLCGLMFGRKGNLSLWIAVVLSVGALYLLCIEDKFYFQIGDLLLIGCAFCFTLHIYFIDKFTKTVDGLKLSCAQFLVTAIITTITKIVCILLGKYGVGNPSDITSVFAVPNLNSIASSALPILYVGIFSSGVAYTLQILSQKGNNPTVISILMSLESVFAVIAGAVVLHQKMTVREYIGCAVMFAAVVLAQIEPSPKKLKN